ncbi:MAG: hypothetical protein ACM3NW_08785 [Syntrophomonadaceae bacterium]
METARVSSLGSAAGAASAAEGTVTLRFRLVSADERSLEALRDARRAMLREEWTRGVEEGEPSLEDAVFSAYDVAWEIPACCVAAGRAKLEELVARANRALTDPSVVRAVPRAAAARTS